ncbi:ATP-grasp domain-containing protein [Oleidesulfovibrio sp.]|uniref:ATP-grasp domain-containing protein n=1 Tax=Oleidesulfovibrio sp. TaxID=2909707 RepID=UPI003A8BC658
MASTTHAPKTILLLGASQDQTFAIRTAREIGLRTLVVDYVPDSVGFALADEYALVSTRDVAALKELCDQSRERGYPVSGVLVMGSDIPTVVAEIAEYLGTPAISVAGARLASHKLLMKQKFAEHGIPIPWFSEVHDVDHLRELVKKHGPKLIIKPVDRSGSRGVFQITPDSDLEALFTEAREQSFSGGVMLEEFLEGEQLSTESIMWQGKAYTVGYADRNYEMMERLSPQIIENGGTVPSTITAEEKNAVNDLVERAARALQIENGVAKGDIVMTPAGPKIIEMAARLSGGDFSESLIPLGCGVNIVAEALRIAVGLAPDLDALKPKWERWIANRYFFPEAGLLKEIHGADAVLEQPWVHKLDFWKKIGTTLPKISCHADRLGVFIVSAPDKETLEQRIRHVYETIAIITE